MPMKVSVCFDKVKVLVPVGSGEILVRELIEKAITRYKKAQGKANDYWVSVHVLRAVNDDSILDPDDTLCDVVDDREQLYVDFEEQGGPRTQHNGGDGQSVSSASPDIFSHEITNLKPQHSRGFSFDSNHDVVVTQTDITSGSGLTVRRGSEPALNILDEENQTTPPIKQTSKSHEDLILDHKDDSISSKDGGHKPVIKGGAPREREKTPPFSRFARDSWRQSLGNQPNMHKWLEAQERQEDRIKQVERQGPVGGATSPEQDVKPLPKKEVGILIRLKNDGTPLGIHVVPDFNELGRESGLMVQGIEDGGRIEQDGRLKVHDRIIDINGYDLHDVTFPKAQEIFRNAMKTEEVKLKVVKHSVPGLPRKPPPAVLPKPKGHSPVKPSPLTLPPQQFELGSSVSSPDDTSSPLDLASPRSPGRTRGAPPISSQSKPSSSSYKNTNSSSSSSDRARSASPVKSPTPFGGRTPPAPPQRHPSTTLSSPTSNGNEGSVFDVLTDSKDSKHKRNNSMDNSLEINKPYSERTDASTTSTPTGTLTKKREAIIAPTNTKKIGKKIVIELVKEREGLGFSVTTRDNATGGPSPIYIKNILPKGAAVSDGRLKAGDRLLEVNDEEMTGKTQSEAVAILRNVGHGCTVRIAVSRQEIEAEEAEEEQQPLQEDPFKLPRLLPNEVAGDDDGTLGILNQSKELIELNIPMNNTWSAGLGVSVKGKTVTTEEGTRDLGIFVKAVIHGGAASKDGRLQVNDQLLEANQVSLVNHTNTEAMELLRDAMQIEGPVLGCINMKIARRIGAPSPSPFTSPRWEEMEWEREINNNNNDSLDNTDHVTSDGQVGHESGRGSPVKAKIMGDSANFKSPNGYLDRTRGGNGIRNQSYMRANHESFFDTPESHAPAPAPRKHLIDLSKQRPRPHSTLGLDRGSPSNSDSSDDGNKEPAWIKGPDWSRHASQTSEDSEIAGAAGDGFSRDGFGRQSMSEKRKGHGDPRSSEIYQKVRGLKELNKANIRGPPPPTNMKRFSSLENLSTLPVDPDADVSASFEDDDEDSSPRPRMERRRGGNESFRAAVDRSYDPVPKLNMDPLEEEGSESGSAGQDRAQSARSSVSDADDGKKKMNKKNKEARKSGGLLKGFFKFGSKGRKTPVEEVAAGKPNSGGKQPASNTSSSNSVGNSKEPGESTEDSAHREHIAEEERRWREAEAEYEKLQEQYKRLQGGHQDTPRDLPSSQSQYTPFPFKPPEPHSMGHSAPVISTRDNADPPSMSRAEKIQQLRADHQRRHQERMGHYPHEDKEEEYERQIQEDEKKAPRFTTEDYFFYQKYGHSAIPSQNDLVAQQGQRSRPSSRNQAERPNSRVGVGIGGGGEGNYMMTTSTSYHDYREFQQQQQPTPGFRHVSDSNMNKTSNFHRPQSRGQSASELPNYQHQNHHQYQSSDPQQLGGVVRGATPSYDRERGAGISQVRGPTPSYETQEAQAAQAQQQRNMNFRNNNGNYQYMSGAVPRGGTPTNATNHGGGSDHWNYAEDSEMRRVTNHVNRTNVGSNRDQLSSNRDQLSSNRDHLMTGDGGRSRTHEVLPPGGGNYAGQGGNYGNPASSNYGNSSLAYRDPVFTAMAGKRPVKSLQQPNSAKV